MIFLMKQKSFVTLCTVAVSINLLLTGCLAHKIKKDFHDELTFVPIKASIEKARDSFVDSAAWDVESVLRLTSMLRESQKAEPEVEQLQIMPGRRFMNYADSLKAFPSLSQDTGNNFYYDTDATHNEQEPAWNSGLNADNSVIVITNPSEARLPADTISVKLLRCLNKFKWDQKQTVNFNGLSICTDQCKQRMVEVWKKETMEARAKAARSTPTTKLSWKTMV